jgi:branched-chain amino acid transport system ATP-binding protein/branched-chain amino acid transport system permease protein
MFPNTNSYLLRSGLCVVGLLLAAASFFANDYQLHVMTIIMINIMLALSLNWVMGYLGHLTLANAAIFGIGAYTTAILMARWPIPFPLALIISAITGASVSALVALPALRLRGFFLAIATLAFGVFAHWVFLHGGSITAGAGGLVFRRPDFSVFGLAAATGMFLISLLMLTATLWWTSRLVASSFGRRSLCISEQEMIAPSLGIDVVRHKFKVFLVSGSIAGASGALFAGLLGLVDPESFNFGQMILQFMMVVLGGLGSIVGSIIGAVVVTGLFEGLRAFKGLHEIALGSALLAVILFSPRGLYRIGSSRWAALIEARSGGSALRGMNVVIASTTAATTPPRTFAAATDAPALVVDGVSKEFGGLRALDMVSFEVKQGSIHGLIGPNGSGKSTMLNLITRITGLDSGRILMFGKDVSAHNGHRTAAMGLGRTFQNLQLVGELTVLENVMLGADLGLHNGSDRAAAPSHKLREDISARIAMETLEFVGMASFACNKATELSGGQMRLVEIARALAARPRLLLLDEPAAGLSLNRIDTVRELILKINRELGVTVILVEHVLNLVLEVSDSITVLSAGKVLASGTPEIVRNNTVVQAAYLGHRASPQPNTNE